MGTIDIYRRLMSDAAGTLLHSGLVTPHCSRVYQSLLNVCNAPVAAAACNACNHNVGWKQQKGEAWVRLMLLHIPKPTGIVCLFF